MRQLEIFFNTVPEKAAELVNSIRKAETQTDKVYNIFKTMASSMTPHECHQIYEAWHGTSPLTSIRRAITTLTIQGKLRETGVLKMGNYGKQTNTWQVIQD